MFQKSALVALALMLMLVPLTHAAIESELDLFQSGAGQASCTVTVSTGNIVANTCTGLVASSTGDHGILTLTGTWDATSFSNINVTAKGGAATTLPTEQATTQTNATTTNSGVTLEVEYSDTSLVTPGSSFLFATSSTIDAQIASSSTVSFTSLIDTSNNIPATTPICSTAVETGVSSAGNCTGPGTASTLYALSTDTVMNFGAPTFSNCNAGCNIGLSTTISIIPATVPEPASIFLLGTLLMGGTVKLRRKMQRS